MRITATRRLQYSIGHRVFRHEGKCAHLHGHNFVFFLTAEAEDSARAQDSLGRVIDFGVLKAKLGDWLERFWDHGMLVFEQDEEVLAALRSIAGQKKHVVPFNPTAENMAKYVLEVVGPQVLRNTGVHLVKVAVHETENGIAEASL